VFGLVNSAANMALPAFAAERRAAARSAASLLLGAGASCYRSISPSRTRSAANTPHAAAAVE